MSLSIDYKIEAKDRWALLLTRLAHMTLKQRKDILIAVVNYKSGEDMCNSVYMGGMATAGLCRAIGRSYSHPELSFKEHIEALAESKVTAGLKSAMHTIEYMLANPRKKCPCCGQVVKDE